MTKPTYITAEGLEKLKSELEYLTGEKRTDIAKRLRIAIQQGDLKENADYIATKEEQGFVEGRIQELEYLVHNATIIEKNHKRGIVEIGDTVTIQEDGYDPETYQVVGASEANPREGRISNESPIGQAIMGKRLGDKVSAAAPGGSIEFKIIGIE